MKGRQVDFAQAAAGAGREPAQIVGDFHQRHRQGFEAAAQLDGRLLSRLRLEVIGRLAQWNAGGRRQTLNGLPGKLGMSVQSAAHGRPPQGQFLKPRFDRLKSFAGQFDLAGVGAEFVPQRYRNGILQVGAADFAHGREQPGLARQFRLELREGRLQMPAKLYTRRQVDGRGDDVVARLPLIYVVVGVDRGSAAFLAGQDFVGPTGQHLVYIHVGRSARPRLKYVHYELVIMPSLNDLFGGLGDGFGRRCIQLS